MTTPAASAQVLPTYGFFTTLPRELRNNIYDHLYQDIEQLAFEANFRMRIHAPIPSLRLLNRQFKREYDEQLDQNNQSKLAVTQNSVYCEPELAKCPRLARYTAELTLNMLACDDGCSEGCSSVQLLHTLQDWFWGFTMPHLPALRSVRVSLGVFYDSCVHRTLLALEKFAISGVVEVKLLPCRYSSVEISPGCVSVTHDHHGYTDRFERGDEDILALATWTPKGGIVHHPVAFEQCMREGLLGRWAEVSNGKGAWDGMVFPSEAEYLTASTGQFRLVE